ncbi:hypothetical protein [Paenibacillus sp.]|uniref:hypothetical protein n=1 Tax=Paenibacillus sp. TaxID=58172 RepID=UPI002D68F2FC|nr:hypothetical protein [Paenibacillus sp.]HZG55221.1 hypothetical protein [Paenibacillus sp.]
MKIAFEIKVPEPEAFFGLLDESGAPEANARYDALLRARGGVVAAYDGDALVGVGAEGFVAVHPSYKQRDIEHNMKKLVGR